MQVMIPGSNPGDTSKEKRTQRVRFSLETMRSLQERDAHFVRDVDLRSVMHAYGA